MKARRSLSPAQIASRDARRATFRELANRVATMTPEARAELAANFVPLSIEGRAYSAVNSALLVFQKPSGTVFGGYRQWLAAGRCVKKGEHGVMIWWPVQRKAASEPGIADVANGERCGFMIGTVFDVTQTAELTAEAPAETPAVEPEMAEACA